MSAVEPSVDAVRNSDAVRQEVSAAYARALERAKAGAGCCGDLGTEAATESAALPATQGCCGAGASESAPAGAATQPATSACCAPAATETASAACCAPAATATTSAGCCGPTAAEIGDAAANASGLTSELAGYDTQRELAPEVASFGCGNPLAFAAVKPGQTVVDLGSGPGLDLILAARRVGPSGYVIGVDMTDVMIAEARRNAARAGFANVEVRKGLIENLPVAAGTVDWVISNCVINLSPEKPRVFAEIARVLRPGGQFRISDIVVEELPAWIRQNAAAYAACVAGAIPEAEYIAGLERAGLTDVRVEHRLAYSAAQIRGLVDHDLKSYGLDPASIEGAFAEVEGKVWSAYFTGRKA